jgi:hypothetical protein
LFWSPGIAPFDRQLENIAFQAWEEDVLLVITLDTSERPVGLRDLPVIAVEHMLLPGDHSLRNNVLERTAKSIESSVTIGMRSGFPDYVRARVEDNLIARAREDEIAPMTPGGSARLEYTGTWAYVPLAAIALALVLSWLNARDVLLLACAAAIVFGGYLVFVAVRRMRARSGTPRVVRGIGTDQPPYAEAPTAKPSELFVSYAHADTHVVDQVLDGVRAAGAAFWIDRAALQSGSNWAGEIVRAIKTARGVLVMCSTNAFGSDHVKREVYLADKYKKAIVPIFVEPAEPPDDFEYFLAGIQRLDWYRASGEERAAALAAAVARF